MVGIELFISVAFGDIAITDFSFPAEWWFGEGFFHDLFDRFTHGVSNFREGRYRLRG